MKFPIMLRRTHEICMNSFRRVIIAQANQVSSLKSEIDFLDAELKQSRKNDTTRDPATGRFVKRGQA